MAISSHSKEINALYGSFIEQEKQLARLQEGPMATTLKHNISATVMQLTRSTYELFAKVLAKKGEYWDVERLHAVTSAFPDLQKAEEELDAQAWVLGLCQQVDPQCEARRTVRAVMNTEVETIANVLAEDEAVMAREDGTPLDELSQSAAKFLAQQHQRDVPLPLSGPEWNTLAGQVSPHLLRWSKYFARGDMDDTSEISTRAWNRLFNGFFRWKPAQQKFSNYLYRCVRYAALDYWKSQKKQRNAPFTQALAIYNDDGDAKDFSDASQRTVTSLINAVRLIELFPGITKALKNAVKQGEFVEWKGKKIKLVNDHLIIWLAWCKEGLPVSARDLTQVTGKSHGPNNERSNQLKMFLERFPKLGEILAHEPTRYADNPQGGHGGCT